MLAILASVWLAAAPIPKVTTATGQVLGEDGKPVPSAEVCEISQASAENCKKVDEHGGYSIRATHPSLLVRARGYVPVTVDAAPLAAAVKLQKAAVLLVSVVDANHRPLQKGKVMLDTPSGKRIGDSVPFNKAGVRISTLEPGTIFVRAEASGYEPAGPIPVELNAGAERSVTVTMKRLAGH